MRKLSVVENNFVVDEKPVRIISGAIHYFRVVPEYWRDRLLKLKACGLNTVETYVPWNLHEPQTGEFRFDGMLDLEKYIKTAAEIGLMVIVRPGPYICSEWDLGGLPSWLLADPRMRLRCSYQPYLDAVDRYFDILIPKLIPLQFSRGGPIIAMQVENEYGSYGNDKKYLHHLEKGMRSRNIDVILFTSDGPLDSMLQGGTLPHLLKTVNFGSKPKEAFAKLREYQPSGPLMCAEFWDGWFDHWKEEHHCRDIQDAAAVLNEMLSLGASVNFYMFHGGTNFGFMNGANHMGKEYQPVVTSYDFDAPLNEAGDPTPKYHAFRKVISKYIPLSETIIPPSSLKKNFGVVELKEQTTLFDSLNKLTRVFKRPFPEPMEAFGQNYGFILYRTRVTGPRESCQLILQDVHDRAQVFVNGEYQGLIERDNSEQQVALEFGKGEFQLDILVENMGRINYGPLIHDRKGITEGVRLGNPYPNQFLYHWEIYPLPLDDLSGLHFQPGSATTGPIFCRGTFTVDSPADTFLALTGWTKGVCFLNGFNLGRYWNRGPQQTLYVPGPLLQQGENELVVFEIEGMSVLTVEFRDQPSLE